MAKRAAVVGDGLAYIAKNQRSDGGFDGLASADPDGFSAPRVHPTIFFAALIGQACSGLSGAEQVCEKVCNYLLAHKSSGWSWNYWQRDAAGKQMRGYPDDLDDTACALAAIYLCNPELIDGAVLGYIGQQLVASEIAPGGPYQTWLVPLQKQNQWHDVDVAVNANVAYVLSLLGVQLPALDAYVATAPRTRKLTSSYYLGDIPSLYFICRANRPQHRAPLQKLVGEKMREPAGARAPIMNALLLSAACRLDLPKSRLAALASVLVAQRTGDHWPAAALYVEPPVDGVPFFAGSAPLTTAFACEALARYERLAAQTSATTSRKQGVKWPEKAVYGAVAQFARTLPGSELQKAYAGILQRVREIDADGQISQLPMWLADDVGVALSTKQLGHLQEASIHGWVAYTLYDDVLDGEPAGVNLSTATIALRQCVAAFERALPGNETFKALVERTLQVVDSANAWESAHARLVVVNGVCELQKLPNYKNLGQLADKSWGHIVASYGVLLAAGYRGQGSELRNWQTFFHHFLIARQLNDDAHDWQDDLQQGQLSAVVCMVLARASVAQRLNISEMLPSLQQCFWEEVAEGVCKQVEHHLRLAAAALQKCTFLHNAARYQALLAHLQHAVDATRSGRSEALAFMQSFTKDATV